MIRFCTFNVENLFTRPKAMNLLDQALATEKLKTIAELQEELAKAVYDKPKIVALANAARDYFKINKTRGANPLSWDDRNHTHVVKVNGRDKWEGFVELTRDRFEEESVRNTGDFLKSLKADVIALCEVENMDALRRFRTDRLGRAGLSHELLIDGNDPRGIDVAILSRHPIGRVVTHIHDRPAGGGTRVFSRDCLMVEILPPGGGSLWILQNHLKSKLDSSSSSDARRKAQASRIAEILEAWFDLARDHVIVSGDLNDTPDSAPLAPLLSFPGLRDVFDVAMTPAAERWTYAYRADRNQIDYVLVSDALAGKLASALADRTGMANLERLSNGREQSRPGITSWKNAASDHAAVIADFNL